MEEIKWQRGQYLKFYAKMKIRLGGQQHSYTVESDDEFEFDGTMCRYSGMEFSQPGIRRAIAQGWASPVAGDNTHVDSFQPGRNIASATSINRDLSRVQRVSAPVGVNDMDEDTVLNIGDRSSAMKDPNRGHLNKSDNRRTASHGMSVGRSDVDSQDGVVVSRIKTSTHAVVDVAANPNRARELEMASYDDGFGRSEEREGVSIKTNMGSVRGSVVLLEDMNEGKVVGNVRGQTTTHSDGITVQDTSNIRQKASRPKRNIVPSAPSPVIDAATAPNAKIVLAKSICSDFPTDWNFFAKLDDKLQRIEKLGVSKQLLKALFASESKQLKKVLAERYPKLVA